MAGMTALEGTAMSEHPIRWLATLIALVMCVAGCNAGLTPATGSTAACPWLSPSAAPQASGGVQSDTIVMIDTSASFWPKAGASVQLPDNLVQLATSELLTNFGSRGIRLISLGFFDGSSTTIDWKIGGVALPVPTGDDQEIQAEQQAAGNCLNSVVASAESTAPQVAGTDEMAALAGAGGQLQGASASDDHVVLITDGLSNTGCLNLSKVIRQGQSASAVLAACPEHAGLAALRGVDLRLFGVGFQAANPPLTTAEQAWVENYWQGLCIALGVASPASCMAPAKTDVARTSVVSRPADPTIVFPAVPPGAGRLTVPADLLFAFDSATLSSAGQSYLDIVLQQIKGQGRTITEVIGHTDAVGSVDYNKGLSQRRAAAVQAYAASRGFTSVRAVGVGEADPACSPQYTPAGAPIKSCMAQNRRVQIILGG
jgi:outer membrane protein OmpA-like peptidoglycan-associated protein